MYFKSNKPKKRGVNFFGLNYLNENALLKLDKINFKCPYCQTLAKKKGQIKINKNPSVFLMSCAKCHLKFPSQLPSDETLHNSVECFYNSFYEKYRTNTSKISFSNPDNLANNIAEKVEIDRRKSFRILDFGGGDGTISKMVASRLLEEYPAIKFDIYVVDKVIKVKKEQKINSNITVRQSNYINNCQQKYELILAVAVLGHVKEINETLNEMFDYLNVGGYFFTTTPYVSPIIRILPILKFGYPGVLYDIGAEFWHSLFRERKNFKILSSRPSMVESSYKGSFFRTLIGTVLKIPALIEIHFKKDGNILWPYYGGWELFAQKDDELP